ncbi:hypothetical protein DIZ76_012199 [Coccidioides immitis]|nr:hypothetical protein DIZ76_012199 [Coccidioides immitis]
MPSKLQLDVNLWFLYICLQKSDYKTIDFSAVGQAANINPPAARMRFTRLKKAIESGALNSSTGTSLVVEGAGSMPLSIGNRKGKAQPNAAKRAKATTKSKADSKAKSDAPKPGAGSSRPGAMDPVVKMETDDVRDYGIRDKNSVNIASNEDDDEDDIPLAVKRRAELARKRYGAVDGAAHEKKRRKIDFENQNLVSTVPIGFPSSEGRTCLNSMTGGELGSSGIAQASCFTGADWVGYIPQLQEGVQQSSFANMQPRLTTSSPLRAWREGVRLSNPYQKYPASPEGNGSPTQLLPNMDSFEVAASSQITCPSTSTMSQARDSHIDTISLSSTSSLTSPVIEPAASQVASLQQMDTLCNRYPGFQETTDKKWSWRQYRLPHIVVTDMDPHSPRNWLNPGSLVAIGKAEKAVNNALFGPGSPAFGRKLPLSRMQEAEAEGKGKDPKQYLEVPWVPLAENPRE